MLTQRITPGDKVRYHGSLESEHGEYFVIAVTDTWKDGNEKYVLSHFQGGAPYLSNVRPQSVTLVSTEEKSHPTPEDGSSSVR